MYLECLNYLLHFSSAHSKKCWVVSVNTLLGCLCWVKILGCLEYFKHTVGLLMLGQMKCSG